MTSCQDSTPAGVTTTAPAPLATTSPATAPTSAAAEPPAQQWTMPNLIGANLQQAQNRIQTLTGGAIFFTSSHDATGKARNQVLDSNWKVCSQNIAAGTPITAGTKIDFGTVKLTESCP